LKLKDKVIVITGSSKGIGKSIAGACIAEGAKVVISSRNLELVKKTCNEFDPGRNMRLWNFCRCV
jgi:NAD(P)-dependent dehydrogenase (short-subunit alcohol dehydrogenase family)